MMTWTIRKPRKRVRVSGVAWPSRARSTRRRDLTSCSVSPQTSSSGPIREEQRTVCIIRHLWKALCFRSVAIAKVEETITIFLDQERCAMKTFKNFAHWTFFIVYKHDYNHSKLVLSIACIFSMYKVGISFLLHIVPLLHGDNPTSWLFIFSLFSNLPVGHQMFLREEVLPTRLFVWGWYV